MIFNVATSLEWKVEPQPIIADTDRERPAYGVEVENEVI